MEDVKLWNDKRDLFAIMKTTEKAYVRDVISSSEYEIECEKLIAQFKTLISLLNHIVPSIERFHDSYKMDCPSSLNRLLICAIPATIEHRVVYGSNSASVMDSLKLNMIAVDQVHPLLLDLLGSINMFKILGDDFEGKVKMMN